MTVFEDLITDTRFYHLFIKNFILDFDGIQTRPGTEVFVFWWSDVVFDQIIDDIKEMTARHKSLVYIPG